MVSVKPINKVVKRKGWNRRIDELLEGGPWIAEGLNLNFINPPYLVSDEKEFKKLYDTINTFELSLRFDRTGEDIRNMDKIIRFYEPSVNLVLVDDSTFTCEESDEISDKIRYPLVQVNFFGELAKNGYPKEHIFPYGKTRALFPISIHTKMALLAPHGAKYNYMEIYFSEKPIIL
jgi:hypothetical protein